MIRVSGVILWIEGLLFLFLSQLSIFPTNIERINPREAMVWDKCEFSFDSGTEMGVYILP